MPKATEELDEIGTHFGLDLINTGEPSCIKCGNVLDLDKNNKIIGKQKAVAPFIPFVLTGSPVQNSNGVSC